MGTAAFHLLKEWDLKTKNRKNVRLISGRDAGTASPSETMMLLESCEDYFCTCKDILGSDYVPLLWLQHGEGRVFLGRENISAQSGHCLLPQSPSYYQGFYFPCGDFK